MARKFGKKNVIKVDPLAYNIGLLGESGIGKSSTLVAMCEKLVGEDGYMLFSYKDENAADAIAGAVWEEIEDWSHLTEIVDDIIENRDTDYKDLKVIIHDTLDLMFEIAEDEVVRIYNRDNPDKAVKSVASAYGGFQRGEAKVIELVTGLLWELKKVGISYIVVGHVKKRTKTDPVTGEEYDVLTTNMMNKYFDSVKNKLHILGVASIDRTINTKLTKDKITGKTKTHGEVELEKRIITFRDNNFTIESKSRFTEITDRIPLNADEFIQAIQNAIEAEHNKQVSAKSIEEVKVEQEKEKEKQIEQALEVAKEKRSIDEERNKELLEVVKSNFTGASEEVKAQVKELMAQYEIPNFKDASKINTEGLEKITDLL